MINLKKYTDYKDGKPDNNNIFCKNNKIEFEGYGDITGLTTSGFWQGNSTKYIIPRLFFSDEYSDTKFDNARKNVMTYINYVRKTRKQNELNSINEYIETLNSKKKEVQDLIKLRDELLFKEKELVLLNNELKNNEMVNMRAV